MNTALDPQRSWCMTKSTMPPMWVSGNWSSVRSSAEGGKSVAWKWFTAPRVDGVWSTPFGSAVVPDV